LVGPGPLEGPVVELGHQPSLTRDLEGRALGVKTLHRHGRDYRHEVQGREESPLTVLLRNIDQRELAWISVALFSCRNRSSRGGSRAQLHAQLCDPALRSPVAVLRNHLSPLTHLLVKSPEKITPDILVACRAWHVVGMDSADRRRRDPGQR